MVTIYSNPLLFPATSPLVKQQIPAFRKPNRPSYKPEKSPGLQPEDIDIEIKLSRGNNEEVIRGVVRRHTCLDTVFSIQTVKHAVKISRTI